MSKNISGNKTKETSIVTDINLQFLLNLSKHFEVGLSSAGLEKKSTVDIEEIHNAIQTLNPSLDEMFLLLKLLPLEDEETFDIEEALLTHLYLNGIHHDSRIYNYMPSSPGVVSLVQDAIRDRTHYEGIAHPTQIPLFKQFLEQGKFVDAFDTLETINHPTPEELRYILCAIIHHNLDIPFSNDVRMSQLIRKYRSILPALSMQDDYLYYRIVYGENFRPEVSTSSKRTLIRKSRFWQK